MMFDANIVYIMMIMLAIQIIYSLIKCLGIHMTVVTTPPVLNRYICLINDYEFSWLNFM